ncbi:MAG: alpha/beta hydrolase [Acidimicrobiales bacterium]
MEAFAATAPMMAGLLPRGDGGTVLVLPGFMAADGSTKPLRALLGTLGYEAHGWGLGRNIGPTGEIVEGLVALVDRLRCDNGPIHVVGWSLGGMFARELARLDPDAVHQVITLGSLFQTIGPEQSNAAAAFRALQHRHTDTIMAPHVPSWARDRCPMPTTSIYTKGDGIVNWHQCLNRKLPYAENVEVYGSHCGLGHNPAAMFVIADRLATPTDDWRPFRAPLPLKALYPHAVDFDTASSAA